MKHHTQSILKRLILFSFLVISATASATWTPIIRHFTPKNYNAGTQNWDIAEHPNGWVYIANNYGLLETDGTQWQLYGIHNATAIRSLAIGEDGAIFVGGTDEFGVFRANSLGGLDYEKLSNAIPERYKHFGEVWDLQIYNNQLYIQTRHHIFIHDLQGECNVIDPGAIISKSLVWEGNLYIATSRDIYVESGGRLHTLRGSEALHNSIVCGILPYGKEGILIATDFNGLFIYNGKSILPFHTEADKYISDNQLYTITCNSQQIALGTVLGGVVLIDINGKNSKFLTRTQGLQNNTILSILFDHQNNLWLGLDNGLDIAITSHPILFLRDPNVHYGSGYASATHNGQLYLGTNQGLYHLPTPQSNIKLIEGSQGQVWDLTQVGNTLFCCHNRGLFYLDNNKLKTVECNDGVWKICPLTDKSAIAGTYSGFYYLQQSHKGQWELQYLEGFEETALYFTIDATGKIWLLSSKGVERLTFDTTNYSISSELIIEQSSAQQIYSLASWRNQILITSDKLCAVVDSTGTLSYESNIYDKLSGKQRYLNIVEDEDSNLWYIYNNRVALRQYDASTQTYTQEKIIWTTSQIIGGFSNLESPHKGAIIMGAINGFYYTQAPETHKVNTSNIYIRKIQSLTTNAEILYGESYNTTPSHIQIEDHERAIRIYFSGNKAATKSSFRTRLYPLEESFTPWQETPYRDFISLPPSGDFRLDIEILSTANGQIDVRSIDIRLLPPFYLTWWAKCIYIIIFCCIVALFTWRINLYIKRSKQKVTDAKNREISEQQLRILQLENEKAQFDLRNKSQELSNILLSEANRKEWNTEVLNDIHRIVDLLNADRITDAKNKIQQLQQRIARNGETNINWKRFEENFDIVNNQFITRLSKHHPWMNKQERRLCVYIHMGLSSKEIAPLLNLSTRAVEMMRYRVRNKMQIDSAISLKQYFRELQTQE